MIRNISQGKVVLEHEICEEFYKQYEYLSALGQFKSELFVFHVPNERRASPQYYAKLHRMGVVSGVADYCIFNNKGKIAFIEFKRNAAACKKLNDQQQYFRETCEQFQVPYLLTYSVEEAIDFLKSL
jgi:hypothetical protein